MKQTLAAVRGHIAACRSVIIASTGPDGRPHTSYAPFAAEDDRFYVLVSDAAAHTRNLLRQPACSLLFIEDEGTAAQVFARKRVSLECSAAELPRTDPGFEAYTALLRNRFGEIVTMLCSMADFRLMELIPSGGEAVFGFGDAYTLSDGISAAAPKRIGHRTEDHSSVQ